MDCAALRDSAQLHSYAYNNGTKNKSAKSEQKCEQDHLRASGATKALVSFNYCAKVCAACVRASLCAVWSHACVCVLPAALKSLCTGPAQLTDEWFRNYNCTLCGLCGGWLACWHFFGIIQVARIRVILCFIFQLLG